MGGVSVERSDPFTPPKTGSPTRAAENECGEHRELSSDPFTPQKEMHQLQSHRGRNVTSGWGERGAGSGERRSPLSPSSQEDVERIKQVTNSGEVERA